MLAPQIAINQKIRMQALRRAGFGGAAILQALGR